jgi:hypothetical protein
VTAKTLFSLSFEATSSGTLSNARKITVPDWFWNKFISRAFDCDEDGSIDLIFALPTSKAPAIDSP